MCIVTLPRSHVGSIQPCVHYELFLSLCTEFDLSHRKGRGPWGCTLLFLNCPYMPLNCDAFSFPVTLLENGLLLLKIPTTSPFNTDEGKILIRLQNPRILSRRFCTLQSSYSQKDTVEAAMNQVNSLGINSPFQKNLWLSVCKRIIPTARPPRPIKLVMNFAGKGCCVVSSTDPYGR
jgi:hypothetical protein